MWFFNVQPSLTAIGEIPDNPLQTAVLNLFVSLKYRFPNLIVGMITRDSVKKALMNGITADQVRVVRFVMKQTLKVLLEDHQLPGHTCASADAEECKHSDVSLSSFELIIHQNPLLPVTVQDQIRLWELEKNRLKSSEGELLNGLIELAKYFPPPRLFIYVLYFTSRLRAGAQLRKTVGCCSLGKRHKALFFR